MTGMTENQIHETWKEELIGKVFPVLDHGFVQLIDVMGSDHAIEEAARVSYGEGTRQVSDTRGLLRYLMRHRHTTPFEMVEIKLRVKVPMDCWRQWIRHRTANVNEYSTRYSEAIDEAQRTPPNMWRLQSGTNKQGSSGFLTEWPEKFRIENNNDADPEVGAPPTCNVVYQPSPTLKWTEHKAGPANMKPGEYLSDLEETLQSHARHVYTRRLELGVAREQARKDLPLSTYTIAYWKADLHNLLHFLSLRMDSHAQWEIRQYATIIGEKIVAPLFPITWEAFVDYRLQAISLTRLEIEAIKNAVATQYLSITRLQEMIPNKREREECIVKLGHLGLSSHLLGLPKTGDPFPKEKEMSQMSKPNRYVVYSDNNGVYLGHSEGVGIWSNVNPNDSNSAPTFLDEADLRAYLRQQSPPVTVMPEHRLIQVWPDLPGDRASMEACANSALPAWEPKK